MKRPSSYFVDIEDGGSDYIAEKKNSHPLQDT